MGFDRHPVFGQKRAPLNAPEDDELSQTYTNLLIVVEQESLSQGGPSKAVLNLMVAWMGAAKGRLAALTKAEVAEQFPILRERVANWIWVIIAQWAVIGFLAALVFKK